MVKYYKFPKGAGGETITEDKYKKLIFPTAGEFLSDPVASESLINLPDVRDEFNKISNFRLVIRKIQIGWCN